ncbi:hypothetical protein [Sulfobacillus harzensis]|uniref:Uncharacterized protein n=1 Tax=Sulfobacillus harzensis TaxID=2729629 RepID=A0A7Y0L5F1_9FIRM|nr:hypothetical protein [Sulfobacillus harzensis]NMP22800.1 hypothetical protein [Sulfobacillus harzensis]
MMYCLIPPMAALGVLLGVLTYSRLKDLNPAVWLLLIAASWLPVTHPSLYVAVSQSTTLTVKPAFGTAIGDMASRLWHRLAGHPRLDPVDGHLASQANGGTRRCSEQERCLGDW